MSATATPDQIRSAVEHLIAAAIKAYGDITAAPIPTRDPVNDLPVSASSLLDKVYAIAAAEVAARMAHGLRGAIASHGFEVFPNIVAQWEEEVIGSGADDRWSGRANDLRRVEFDAKREALHLYRSEAGRLRDALAEAARYAGGGA